MITAARRSVLIGAIAVLAAGCGLQKAPHGGSAAGGRGTGRHQHGHGVAALPSGSATPSASLTQCTIADVRVTLDTRAVGVAAGSSYLPLDFTNTSSASCRLAGFPEVAIAATSTGKQVGAAAAADRSATARGMVLTGGHTAHIWLRIADIANIPRAQCKPVAAAGLRIGLPGQSQTTFVGHPLTTCARPVRGTAVLTVEPFRPGSARRGSAQ